MAKPPAHHAREREGAPRDQVLARTGYLAGFRYWLGGKEGTSGIRYWAAMSRAPSRFSRPSFHRAWMGTCGEKPRIGAEARRALEEPSGGAWGRGRGRRAGGRGDRTLGGTGCSC